MTHHRLLTTHSSPVRQSIPRKLGLTQATPRHGQPPTLRGRKVPTPLTLFLILLAALVAIALSLAVTVSWASPAPKPSNPASVIHEGGSWVDVLQRNMATSSCSGTGVWTRPDGTCVTVPDR